MPKGTFQPVQQAQYGRLIEEIIERAAAYAFSILGNRHDAEDAVQQAALRGLERLAMYDPARSFKAWWFAVLRNCCIDMLRSSRARKAVAIESAGLRQIAESKASDCEDLGAGLEKIASEHAEILRLRYFGNMSYRELSEAMSIPEGTVMSRLHYARKALAEEMKAN